MLPANTYIARATGNGGLGETEGGKEQVVIEFKIEDNESPQNGQLISWYGYFTDKTIERTHESLTACGFQGGLEDLASPDRLKACGVTKKQVRIVVDHETYQDKTTAKVKWVNSMEGTGIKKALDPAKAASFAAKMKGAWVNLNKSANGGGMPFPSDDRPPV